MCFFNVFLICTLFIVCCNTRDGACSVKSEMCLSMRLRDLFLLSFLSKFRSGRSGGKAASQGVLLSDVDGNTGIILSTCTCMFDPRIKFRRGRNSSESLRVDNLRSLD